jgi:hypothetical protein
MAGYDISASYSRSQTVGSRAGEGDFTVYGSNRNPPWLTFALIGGGLLAAFLLWRWFKRK